MTVEEFVRLVGPKLIHVTPLQNAEGIAAQGLLPAATLVTQAGLNADEVLLRSDRRLLQTSGGSAQLNHQRPLRMGMNKAADFLDGHTIQSWAAQLDRRIFFWPMHKGVAFARSLAQRTAVIALNAQQFFDSFADHIHLSPINSGNADRRPAKRGDWLYVPATASIECFRENRRKRGLVKTPDTVAEVSVTCPIPADKHRALAA